MQEREHSDKEFVKRVGRNVLSTIPKVSIIIPAYNVTDYICETLDSIAAQKFREYEIIIVNDGSPDTVKFERTIRNRLDEVIYIKQRNAGAGAARNTGIEHARADVIAFLDGDDIWLPDYLTSQYIFLHRHGYDMVYCDAILFGIASAYRRTFMETAPSSGEANFNSILDLRCNVITSGTVALKRSILNAGMFETERVRAHDFLLWLKMAKTGAKIGYQRRQLLKYREHVQGLSGDSISRVERELDAFERVRKTIDLDSEQERIVTRKLAGLQADLAVEKGKSYLLSGDNRGAVDAFREANRHRRSIKLFLIGAFARIAPRLLLKFYAANRASDIELVRRFNQVH